MKNMNNYEKRAFNKSLESLSIATYIAFILSIGSILFKIIGNKDVQTYYFELLLLFAMTFAIFTHRLLSKVYNLPVRILNKKAIDLSSNGRASRLSVYSKDAFAFSIFWMLIKYVVFKKSFLFISIIENNTYQVLAEFFATMIVAIIINMIWFEINIYLFNKTYTINKDTKLN